MTSYTIPGHEEGPVSCSVTDGNRVCVSRWIPERTVGETCDIRGDLSPRSAGWLFVDDVPCLYGTFPYYSTAACLLANLSLSGVVPRVPWMSGS